jgi:glycosyltransferase involved in cell wall biosynthesis
MKISLVVCTKDRSKSLIKCLDSLNLAILNFGVGLAEVVIVDNNSTDDTKIVVRDWASGQPFPVVYVLEKRPGLSAARNAGVSAATGEIIAFTDDDCILSKQYLLDLDRHYTGEIELVIRGGRVELGDPSDLPITIKTDDQAAYWMEPAHPAGFIHGANFTLRREVFDLLGPFDEELGAGTLFPGEDLDYLIRAATAGVRIHYVPDMVVHHFHGRKEYSQAARLFKQYMKANGALYIKHMFKRPQFTKHFFWIIRNWIVDSISGGNFRVDGLPFGYKDIALGNISGMFLYVFRKK